MQDQSGVRMLKSAIAISSWQASFLIDREGGIRREDVACLWMWTLSSRKKGLEERQRGGEGRGWGELRQGCRFGGVGKAAVHFRGRKGAHYLEMRRVGTFRVWSS